MGLLPYQGACLKTTQSRKKNKQLPPILCILNTIFSKMIHFDTF